MRSPATIVAVIARRQFGVFTRDQALRAGYSDTTIRRLLTAGRWIRVHPGVYRDAAVPACEEQSAMAAWLACGRESVVSHWAAARLLELDVPRSSDVCVTVPVGCHADPEGVDVRRTRHLPKRDVVVVKGIRVTSASRTIADLAATVDELVLELALDALWRRNRIEPARLLEYLGEAWCRSRPGTGVLRRLLRPRVGSAAPGSDLETLFVRLLRLSSFRMPILQFPIRTRSGPRKLDAAYEDERVAIELDGFDRHAQRAVLDDDDERQNDIEDMGWTFRRFTWTHVTQEPLTVLTTLAKVLGLFPVAWRSQPISISSSAWARRSASSTSAGVSPRANAKPR